MKADYSGHFRNQLSILDNVLKDLELEAFIRELSSLFHLARILNNAAFSTA